MLVGKVDVAQFLTAKADAADCQRLLDGLYSDSLLGRTTGASGLRGFTSQDTGCCTRSATTARPT